MSTVNGKKYSEKVDVIRTIDREPRILSMQRGMRVLVAAAGCREANTEGKIGSSHFETNEN